MRNVLEAIWWWTRVAVLAAVGIYVLALLFENAGKATRLWYWWGRESDDTPIITIVVVSFLTGGIVTTTGWALLTATISYRRTRESRRERLAFEQRQAMHEKAARLRVKPLPIAKQRVAPLTTRVFASVPEPTSVIEAGPTQAIVAPPVEEFVAEPASFVDKAIVVEKAIVVDEPIVADEAMIPPPPSPPPAGA